jgi:Fe2+ or Zn2+ uptake regulation protein
LVARFCCRVFASGTARVAGTIPTFALDAAFTAFVTSNFSFFLRGIFLLSTHGQAFLRAKKFGKTLSNANRFSSTHIHIAVNAEKHNRVTEAEFRAMCHSRGLAATHQRAAIYQALMQTPGHPSPEEIYDRVHKKVPAMSLATVYKTLHAFLEAGIVHEISLHRGSLRVDPNPDPHHHLVCTECRSIFDVELDAVTPVKFTAALPAGFQVQRCAVEIQGICQRCSIGKNNKRNPKLHS